MGNTVSDENGNIAAKVTGATKQQILLKLKKRWTC